MLYDAQLPRRTVALLLALVPLGLALDTHAQADTTDQTSSGNSRVYDDSSRHSTVSFGWHYAQPLGEFADAQKHFWGAGFHLAFHVKELPFDAGFGVGYKLLENATSTVTVKRNNLANTTGELDLKRRSYAILPMLRFRPIQGRFMFYAEVFGGLRLYSNRYILDTESQGEAFQRRDYDYDNSWEWGTAAGILIQGHSKYFLEVRFARTWGGQATFVDYNNIKLDDKDRLGIGTRTLRTDTWYLQASIATYL